MRQVTIALSKGRLAKYSIDLFEKCGIDCEELKEDTRKLIIESKNSDYRFLLVKPSDVPTYVEYGIADIGIAGKDSIIESNTTVYEMLDLGFGKCSVCIAGFGNNYKKNITANTLRVATKYPNIAKEYYKNRENIEIIKLQGSVELAPLLGLSDVILDIVETGITLKENGLVILEKVCDVSARMIVNRASLKTKLYEINELLLKIKQVLKESEE